MKRDSGWMNEGLMRKICVFGWVGIVFVAFAWTLVSGAIAAHEAHPTLNIGGGYDPVDMTVYIDRTGSIGDDDFATEKGVVKSVVLPALDLGDSWNVYSIGSDAHTEPRVCSSAQLPLSKDDTKGLRDLLKKGLIGQANDEDVALINRIMPLRNGVGEDRDQCIESVGHLGRPNDTSKTDICKPLDSMQGDTDEKLASGGADQIWLIILSDLQQDAYGQHGCPDHVFNTAVNVVVLYPMNQKSSDIQERAGHYFKGPRPNVISLASARQKELKRVLPENPMHFLPKVPIPTFYETFEIELRKEKYLAYVVGAWLLFTLYLQIRHI